MIEHNISGCFSDAIGASGLSEQEFQKWFDLAGKAALRLRQAYQDHSLPLLHIAEERHDIELAQKQFFQLIEGARTVVFLGTGGSSLGGQTIAQLGGWFIPGDDVSGPQKLPRTRIYDNLDPRSLNGALKMFDLESTRFVVISKSGNTAETLVQTIGVIQAFEEAGLADRVGASFLGISEPRQSASKNGLRDLLEPYEALFLPHETGIGGRFSALTNVGLLLAIARGLDPFRLREGAYELINQLNSLETFDDFMPVLGAAVNIGLYKERHINNVVMMPYANQLQRFSQWFVQLWAESLGKDGVGTTPISALGPVDQHSQLQLFMDGPLDKLVTIVAPQIEGSGPLIGKELATRAGLDFIGGAHVGDLVGAQASATGDALQAAGRPVRWIGLDQLDEYSLGQLMMSFMLETIIAADLLGVDVFDQPAVELGKSLARKQFTG